MEEISDNYQDILRDIIFMVDVINLHIKGLIKIQSCLNKEYGRRWLTYYKNTFSYRGELQFERIQDQHHKYILNNKTMPDKIVKNLINIYVSLYNDFQDNVQHINNNEPINQINLDDYVNKLKQIKIWKWN